jgi:single-stranded DNA-binding protein
MNLEVTGKLIVKYDTQHVSDKFKKREFVLELADEINGNTYTNYAKMQLVQAKCDIIDRFNVGEQVKVSFNIKGSKYERDGKESYFTNLDAWRIEAAGAAQPGNGGYNQQPAYNNNYNQGGNNYNQGGNNNGYNNAPPAYNNNNNANNGANTFYNPSPENADDLPF